MAADDAGEKTEQATPRRRAEAREEGQIARSTDLTAAISLLAALVLLKVLGPQMWTDMFTLTRTLGHLDDVSGATLVAWMRETGVMAARILLPFLVLVVALTTLGNVAQSGLLLTWKKLTPQPDRLNPISGAKRIFSGDAIVHLLIGLAKVALISLLAWTTLSGHVRDVLGVGAAPVGGLIVMATRLIFDLALKLAVALLVLGLIDYFIQRFKLERQLRMTKQEVRDELKRMEGDPLIKHRRRQLQARLAMQRIQNEVPKADVVVTNPTEYAVALRYDERSMGAPRVIAKGRDFLALRIRQIAEQHRVAVVERPPLARALYAAVEVGQEVPPQFYRAVAELLAYVYQLRGRVA